MAGKWRRLPGAVGRQQEDFHALLLAAIEDPEVAKAICDAVQKRALAVALRNPAPLGGHRG